MSQSTANVSDRNLEKSSSPRSKKEVFSSKRRFKWTWSIYAEKDISFGAKVVASILAQYYYGSDTGRCDASYAGIAKMGGLSARHVSNLIGELEDKGWLSHVRTGKRNLYSLLRVPAETSNEKPDGKADTDRVQMEDGNPSSYLDKNPSSDHCRSDRQTSADKPLPPSSPSETPSNVIAFDDGAKRLTKEKEIARKGLSRSPPPSRRSLMSLPDSFQLTDERKRVAINAGVPKDEIERAFGSFVNYAKAKATQNVDWEAAWASWCFNYRPLQQKITQRRVAI